MELAPLENPGIKKAQLKGLKETVSEWVSGSKVDFLSPDCNPGNK